MSRLSLFIRDYLLEHGEDYIYNIWKAYKMWCVKKGYKPCKYASFRAFFWHLKDLGLVRKTRVERVVSRGVVVTRHYFAIANPDERLWENPLKVKYER